MEVTEEGVAIIEDPFDFFELDFVVQEDYLLKADWDSIKNLCSAAALSKDPGAVEFFEGLCNNYQFWKRKLRQDFPEDYPEILKSDKGQKRNLEYWRDAYEEQTKTLVLVKVGVDEETRQPFFIEVLDRFDEIPENEVELYFKYGIDTYRGEHLAIAHRPTLIDISPHDFLVFDEVMFLVAPSPLDRARALTRRS